MIHFRSQHAVIGLMTLSFDLVTLKLVRIIVRGTGNLPNNFAVSGTYRSRLIGFLTYHTEAPYRRVPAERATAAHVR